MKLIAVSQRVDIVIGRNERRDALDQHWVQLLLKAGFQTIILPNNKESVVLLMESLPICGVIFTGGNDLVEYGGNAAERDEMELALLIYVLNHKLPALGVCRGMQLFQDFWGIPLQKVSNQVTHQQTININGKLEIVNSFHHWGSFQSHLLFENFAISEEGIIKGIKHKSSPLHGIMWHPERIIPYRAQDINLIKEIFT